MGRIESQSISKIKYRVASVSSRRLPFWSIDKAKAVYSFRMKRLALVFVCSLFVTLFMGGVVASYNAAPLVTIAYMTISIFCVPAIGIKFARPALFTRRIVRSFYLIVLSFLSGILLSVCFRFISVHMAATDPSPEIPVPPRRMPNDTIVIRPDDTIVTLPPSPSVETPQPPPQSPSFGLKEPLISGFTVIVVWILFRELPQLIKAMKESQKE